MKFVIAGSNFPAPPYPYAGGCLVDKGDSAGIQARGEPF